MGGGGGWRVERGGLVSEIFLQRIRILKKVKNFFFVRWEFFFFWGGGGGGVGGGAGG